MSTLDSDMFIDERNWDWLDATLDDEANADIQATVMFTRRDDA